MVEVVVVVNTIVYIVVVVVLYYIILYYTAFIMSSPSPVILQLTLSIGNSRIRYPPISLYASSIVKVLSSGIVNYPVLSVICIKNRLI